VEGLENQVSAEFVSMDIRDALKELNTILGLDITEEILTEIFSKFCIGK
jgi:tRNA modification GTPase